MPENFPEFKSYVLEKLKVYCDAKIWPYEFDRFTRWLSNFKDCETEEYVALHLLDCLIVRSNEMAIASYERLFCGDVLQHLISNSIIDKITLSEWKNKLKFGHISKKIKFLPVMMGESGESGHLIYRLLGDILETNKFEYKSDQDLSDLKVIILVDDVLGSGDQFLEFAATFDLENKLSQYQIIYCPLMACEAGIKSLKSRFSNLIILPAEIIPAETHLFSPPLSDKFRRDQINTKADVKAILDSMKFKYAPRMDHWLGRNDASLCLAFGWGCPNQSLAILYMDHSPANNNWNQLFPRRTM